MFSPAEGSITLRFIWNEYKVVHKLQPNTIKDYEKRLKMIDDWLDLPISLISKVDVLSRYMSMVGENLHNDSFIVSNRPSVSQANYVFKVLRALIEYSIVLYDMPSSNPVKVLKAVKAWRKLEPRKDIISDDKLPLWFETVLKYRSENKRLSDWLLVTIFMGLRKMEGLELSWSEIDLERKLLKLPSQSDYQPRRTKNGREHILPIPEYTFRILKDRAENKEHQFWVFPGEDGKPLSEFYQGYNLITEKSRDIENPKDRGIVFTPHTLRRTFATAAETAEVSARNIQRMLNHTPKNVTEHYTVDRPEKLREPIQKVEDCLIGLGRVEFLLGKEPSSSQPECRPE